MFYTADQLSLVVAKIRIILCMHTLAVLLSRTNTLANRSSVDVTAISAILCNRRTPHCTFPMMVMMMMMMMKQLMHIHEESGL